MRFFSLVLFIGILNISNSWASEASVGTTIKASGQTSTFRRNLIFSQRKDDPVFWLDELRTGPASRMEVVFIDETRLQLGDHAKLSIDELVYEPNAKGKALFTLSQGVFRMVSGALNKIKGSTFTVRTPLATIGVRGTDFWGHQTDKKLTMALLDNGVLEIETSKGRITLDQPLSAVVIEAGKEISQPFTLTQEQVRQARGTVE